MNFKFLLHHFSFMVFFAGNSFYRKSTGFGSKEGNDNAQTHLASPLETL